MIPTNRSVIARLRSRSLEGGCSEDSLCRAARIRVFPRKPVMDRKVLSTKRTISSSLTLAVTFAEQYNSLIEFSRVGTAIFLHWCWEVRVSDYKIYVYIVASLIFMVSQILACQGVHLIYQVPLAIFHAWHGSFLTPLVHSLRRFISQVPYFDKNIELGDHRILATNKLPLFGMLITSYND